MDQMSSAIPMDVDESPHLATDTEMMDCDVSMQDLCVSAQTDHRIRNSTEPAAHLDGTYVAENGVGQILNVTVEKESSNANNKNDMNSTYRLSNGCNGIPTTLNSTYPLNATFEKNCGSPKNVPGAPLDKTFDSDNVVGIVRQSMPQNESMDTNNKQLNQTYERVDDNNKIVLENVVNGNEELINKINKDQQLPNDTSTTTPNNKSIHLDHTFEAFKQELNNTTEIDNHGAAEIISLDNTFDRFLNRNNTLNKSSQNVANDQELISHDTTFEHVLNEFKTSNKSSQSVAEDQESISHNNTFEHVVHTSNKSSQNVSNVSCDSLDKSSENVLNGNCEEINNIENTRESQAAEIIVLDETCDHNNVQEINSQANNEESASSKTSTTHNIETTCDAEDEVNNGEVTTSTIKFQNNSGNEETHQLNDTPRVETITIDDSLEITGNFRLSEVNCEDEHVSSTPAHNQQIYMHDSVILLSDDSYKQHDEDVSLETTVVKLIMSSEEEASPSKEDSQNVNVMKLIDISMMGDGNSVATQERASVSVKMDASPLKCKVDVEDKLLPNDFVPKTEHPSAVAHLDLMAVFSDSPAKERNIRRDTIIRLFDPLYHSPCKNSSPVESVPVEEEVAELECQPDTIGEHVGEHDENKVEECVEATDDKSENTPQSSPDPKESNKKKMDITHEDYNKIEQELTKIRFDLNQLQQEKATLVLELAQKDEVILKIQDEAQKRDNHDKTEMKQLRDKLNSIVEQNNNEEMQLLKNEIAALKEAKAAIGEKFSSIGGLNDRHMSMAREYDIIINSTFQENDKLKVEHDRVKQHLATLELAFADVHSKYERAKETIGGYQQNEETLRGSLVKSNDMAQKYEERYDLLKTHAKGQLEKANKELAIEKDKHMGEMSKLNTLIKRLEIKIACIQQSLDQKNKECAALAALCDEMTGNVSQ